MMTSQDFDNFVMSTSTDFINISFCGINIVDIPKYSDNRPNIVIITDVNVNYKRLSSNMDFLFIINASTDIDMRSPFYDNKILVTMSNKNNKYEHTRIMITSDVVIKISTIGNFEYICEFIKNRYRDLKTITVNDLKNKIESLGILE